MSFIAAPPLNVNGLHELYLYNEAGMRIYKQSGGIAVPSESFYLISAGGVMYSIEETQFHSNGNGNSTMERYNIPDLGYEDQNKEINYQIQDHLGNLRLSYTVLHCPSCSEQNCATVDVQYQINYIAEYLAYGGLLREFVRNGTAGEKFLSTGHERDKQTSWDYRQARYYDADLGRFLAVDPHHSNYLNWSSYHYVAANPISITDPTGRDWFKEHSTGAVLWRDSKDKTYSRSFIDYDGVEVHECYDNIGEHYMHLFPQLEGYISFQGSKPGNFVFGDEIKERLSKLPSNQNPKSKLLSFDTAPWMSLAKSQEGVKELTNNNDGIKVEEYLRCGGLSKGNPWCGSFVNWCLRESRVGVRGINVNRALDWRKFGDVLPEPAFGAIATKTRKGGGHVGFVAGLSPDGQVIILGGNQGHQVKYSAYPKEILQFNYPTGYTPNYSLPIIFQISRNSTEY